MTNSGHTTGEVLSSDITITPHSEPALSDWTAAGARPYLIPNIMRDDSGFDKARLPLTRAQNELRLPNRGMNSWYEWTALRETMCFYGVAPYKDGDVAVRATVLAGAVPAGADRLIGV